MKGGRVCLVDVYIDNSCCIVQEIPRMVPEAGYEAWMTQLA
jgi:hypothetical protein